MAYEAGKPIGPPGPEAAEAQDYEAYQFIVQAVSNEFSKAVREGLQRLEDPELFQEMMQEAVGAENMPEDPESVKDLWRGFWKLARGLDCDIRWRSLSGVPERSYSNVEEIKPNEQELGQEVTGEHPEIGVTIPPMLGSPFTVSW